MNNDKDDDTTTNDRRYNKRKRTMLNDDNTLSKKQKTNNNGVFPFREEKSLSISDHSINNDDEYINNDDDDDKKEEEDEEEENDIESESSSGFGNRGHGNSDSDDESSVDVNLPYGEPNRLLNTAIGRRGLAAGGGNGIQQRMNQYAQVNNNNAAGGGMRYAGIINNYNQLGNNGGGGNNNAAGGQQQNNVIPPTNSNNTANSGGTGGEEEEEEQWKPSLLLVDRIVYEEIGKVVGTPLCFGCENVGKNMVPIRKSNLECLIKTMYEKSEGTSEWAHVRKISEQYEKTIRIPSNKLVTDEEKLLPEWPPALVHQHLYSGTHTNDIELKLKKSLNTCTGVEDLVKDNTLAKRHISKTNARGDPYDIIMSEQWRVMRDAIKTAESLAKTIKLFKKDITDVLNNPHNPFINYSQKKIFTTTRLSLLERNKRSNGVSSQQG